ncbi:MAG: aldose 1-epimerase [Thermoleophilaceae bacterium]
MIELASGSLTAAFAPDAGMVGCSLRHRGEELLGQRGGLAKYRETGSTFGIPLLHPWANRIDREVDSPLVRHDPNGLPIHGLLTASPFWELIASDSARLSARLDFAAHEELMSGFPFAHDLRVDAELAGARLTVRTTVHASGDRPVPIAFGWHPYLTLPAVPRGEWRVELPARRHAELDERGIPTGRSQPIAIEPGPLGDRTYDDLFPELAEPPVFALEGGGRRIELAFGEGYPIAQVYAPPGQDFICFEPMTAPTNALVSGDGLRRVDPGETFGAAFSLSVSAESRS